MLLYGVITVYGEVYIATKTTTECFSYREQLVRMERLKIVETVLGEGNNILDIGGDRREK